MPVGGGLPTSKLSKIASNLYFLSFPILFHVLFLFLSQNGVWSFRHAAFSLTNKIPERCTSVCVSETSGFEFRNSRGKRGGGERKRLNMLYSAYTSHERWQAVYMKKECEATWADYHTPHQRALRFQLMWLADALHAKSVIEPAHIIFQYNIMKGIVMWRKYSAQHCSLKILHGQVSGFYFSQCHM